MTRLSSAQRSLLNAGSISTVIPAKLAIAKREPESRDSKEFWIPATAGMTTKAVLDKVQNSVRHYTSRRMKVVFLT